MCSLSWLVPSPSSCTWIFVSGHVCDGPREEGPALQLERLHLKISLDYFPSNFSCKAVQLLLGGKTVNQASPEGVCPQSYTLVKKNNIGVNREENHALV